jgi:uncharacterized protein YcbX
MEAGSGSITKRARGRPGAPGSTTRVWRAGTPGPRNERPPRPNRRSGARAPNIVSMRVAELWRFPVKSLQGEQVSSSELGPQGLAGDRQFAIFDVDTGFGLTARRMPALLFGAARLREDGSPEIALPDGSVADDDDALSAWLGRPVVLRSAAEEVTRRYENLADFEDEAGRWQPFDGSSGAFQDAEGAAVSMLSSTTYGGWDRRRFRANVLLDGDGEDGLVGHRVRIGDAVLDVGLRIERCVMVTRPQPGGIERDLDVLRTIHRRRDGCLAVGATVARPGRVTVGDTLVQSPGWPVNA